MLGSEGADEQQQVEKKFQALTVRVKTDTERSFFNIMTSRTMTASVLSWTNEKSRFKAEIYLTSITVLHSHISILHP